MINLNEDALICDLAETYQIFDYRSLPLKLVATLSAGLRDDSRIMLYAAGVHAPQNTLLLAAIADRVELFRYGFTEAAKTGKNPPKSIYEKLVGIDKPKNKHGVTVFKTPEEFDAALRRIKGE